MVQYFAPDDWRKNLKLKSTQSNTDDLADLREQLKSEFGGARADDPIRTRLNQDFRKFLQPTSPIAGEGTQTRDIGGALAGADFARRIRETEEFLKTGAQNIPGQVNMVASGLEIPRLPSELFEQYRPESEIERRIREREQNMMLAELVVWGPVFAALPTAGGLIKALPKVGRAALATKAMLAPIDVAEQAPAAILKSIGRSLGSRVAQTAKTVAPRIFKDANEFKTAKEFASSKGIIPEWGTANPYHEANPFKEQLLEMARTKKFNRVILARADRWEMEQVLRGKPAFLSDGNMGDKEILKFASENNLVVGRKGTNLVVARNQEALNKVLSAKIGRELGLSLGYTDIGVMGGGKARAANAEFKRLFEEVAAPELTKQATRVTGQQLVSRIFNQLPVRTISTPSTAAQRFKVHVVAGEKGWIRPDGKMKPQYRRFMKAYMGVDSSTKMTADEADDFILAMNSLKRVGDKPARVPTTTQMMPPDLIKALPMLKEMGIGSYIRQIPHVLRSIGLYKQIWEPLMKAEVLRNEELMAFKTTLGALQKTLGRDSARKIRIFDAIENPLETHLLDDAEGKAFIWFKKFFDDWADRLQLPASQRRKNYITHIFEKSVQGDLDKKYPLDPEVLKAMEFSFAKTTFNPKLKPRVGATTGLKRDPFLAAEAYEQYALRDFYYQPLVKKIATFEPVVESYAGPNAAKFMRALGNRLAGRPGAADNALNQTLRYMASSVRKLPVGAKMNNLLAEVEFGNPAAMLAYNYSSLLFQTFLGLRPVSAIRNLSQQFLAGIDAGAINFSKGLASRGTKEAQLALKESLVLRSRKISFIPGADMSDLGKLSKRSQDIALSMFKWADKENVSNAFLAGYQKGKSLGLPREWAIKMGDEVAMNTQFLYTKMSRSLVEETALGRFFTPFTSWPRNWVELMGKWMTNRTSQTLKDYTAATGNVIQETRFNRQEMLAYLALITMAYGVENNTDLKATEYTGWTSVRSISQFAGGDLPSLEVIGGVASLAAGLGLRDQRMITDGWNKVKPNNMIGIYRNLENIATGKSDWLSLFLYLNRNPKEATNSDFPKLKY